MPNTLSLNLAAVAARFQSDMGKFAQRMQTEGAKAVQDQMTTVRQAIIATSPVDTGFLQAHWGPVVEASTGNVIAYQVENPTEYAGVLEYGGYRSVGPRTVALAGGDLGAGFVAGGGIYSKQAPLGWVRRALAGTWAQYQGRLKHVLRQAWPYVGERGSSDPFTTSVGQQFDINLGGSFQGDISQTARDVMAQLRQQYLSGR